MSRRALSRPREDAGPALSRPREDAGPPRLVYVVTHPVTADAFLRGQLAFMREAGFYVTVIALPGEALDRVREREGVDVVAVPMARAPDPARDIVSLARLVPVMKRLRPDIVNAGTTKGGLLGMLAARAVRAPVRIYLLRGLRLETETGNLRRVLGATERIASSCAHDVVCNSPSLLRLAVEGGYVPREKAIVVGAGSSNGVDTARFARSEALVREGEQRFAEIGIARDEKVVAFVGRLAKDKGIAELLDAFARVRAEIPKARLALLGADLADEKPDPEIARRVSAARGVVVTKTIADLAPWYARIDVLAFPSYREGMPNVPLEAACVEVPVVGFRSTGVVDAVVHGETGTLVAQGDVDGLARGILDYLRDPEKARAHGRAGRARAKRCFDREVVWRAWLELYRARLERRGLPLPIASRV